MDDLKDLAKHVRSTQLVFVLAAAAIVVALSSSDTVYRVAQRQLQDVVKLHDALTADHITESIADSSAALGRPVDGGGAGRLETFVEDALLEYFEARDVHWDSVKFGWMAEDCRALDA